MSYDACLCEVCGCECHTMFPDWPFNRPLRVICPKCLDGEELRRAFLRQIEAYYPFTRVAHRFDVYLTLGT